MTYRILAPVALALLTTACSDNAAVNEPNSAKQESMQTAKADTQQSQSIERWYSDEQVKQGKALFQQTCAVCHGMAAQGLAEDWKKVDENGNYPPPPLNGSAHAWHHPMKALRFTIQEGGAPVGGVMPAFKTVYSDEQIDALIASFQSYWSDEIYANWAARNGS